jgi:drug/metabolite transporter (DMT)-like permease
MKTLRLPQHVVRTLVHHAAQYGWFVALTPIPLAQVEALEFPMPIWSAALAVAFLGERMNRWKVLAAAVGFAVSVVLVKSLTRTDTAIQVSFWMLVVQGLIGLVRALLVWQGPSAEAWGWVVVVAFCGTFSHHSCFARARQHADATVVVPMDFLRAPLTAAVGWAVYADQDAVDEGTPRKRVSLWHV